MLIIEDGAINITKGDDAALNVDITAGEGGDQAYEMGENDVLTLTVREQPSTDFPVLLQVNGLPGSKRILIRSEDTEGLEPGRYSADVQLTDGNGNIYTVWPELEGSARYKVKNLKNFIIMPEVTAK